MQKLIELPFDVLFLKGLLNESQQLAITGTCIELKNAIQGQEMSLVGFSNGRFPKPVLLHNWGGRSNGVQPEELFEFARKTYQRATSAKTLEDTSRWPADFNPEALNAILYPEGGSLPSHQDGAVGWVLAFSFGASCIFRYGENRNLIKSGIAIKLESGDAVLFDGQKYFHEVFDVESRESAPAWFSKDIVARLAGDRSFPGARFNLQFRDASAFNQRLHLRRK